jgi:competence protein ComGC
MEKKINNKSEEKQEEDFYNKEVEKKVDFHVMPEKFRIKKEGDDKTKKTGILIIVFGLIFLIVISILLYTILFGANKDKENETEGGIEHGEVPKIVEKDLEEDASEEDRLNEESIATSSPETDIKNEKETATSSSEIEPGIDTETATSSSETDSEIATSSPETDIESEVKGSIVDLDEDGLSDKEEILLGTSDNNSDSDGDGYDDIVELENLYNPAGEGVLKNNSNIESYSNNSYGYKLLYPTLWERSDLGGDDIIMFNSEENHFIQVIAQKNTNSLSIREWLSEQLGTNIPILDKEISKKGWEGIFNEAGNIIYVIDENKENVFIISYSFNQGDEAIYNNIFNMIINSFEIVNENTEI